jgi:NAD(P)-dependent dehydrogenase (short-subunit alcohol dehydrogenase family)
LITGAAGGIGSETARVCASLGGSLVLVDQDEPGAIAAELRSQGADVQVHAFDIRDRAAVERAVAASDPLDAVVANAGLCPWDDWQDDGWDEAFAKVVDINLLGVIHLARAVLPQMAKRGKGKLVCISSVAGRSGGFQASPHYVAAKGGVVSLVKWLARKGAPHGVLVNGIAPGATVSAMTEGQTFDSSGIPVGRMATPADIAWPIAFLCSDAANYICGATLDVNGGVYMN